MRTRVYLGILILLAFVSLLALPAHAQFTTITATDIQAGDGSPLAAGSMCWLGTNNAGTAIGYRAGTSGQTITAPVCRDIVSGAVATTYKGVAKGALQVADTTLTNPANVCYKVTVTDTSSGKVVLGSYAGAKSGYDCVQPSGTTWSFDTYIPAGTPGTLVTSGPAGPAGSTGPQGPAGATPDIIKTNLMALYRPYLQGSGTSLTDYSVAGNPSSAFPGDSTAPTWGSGGLQFNQANTQAVGLPAALNTARTIQIAAYNSTCFGNPTLANSIMLGSTVATGFHLLMRNVDGGTCDGMMSVFSGSPSTYYAMMRNTSVGFHIWTIVRDGTGDRIYLDGIEAAYNGSRTNSYGVVSTSGNFQFGGTAAVTSAWWSGTLYDAAFYSTALTAAQVQQNAAVLRQTLEQAGVQVNPPPRSGGIANVIEAVGSSITAGNSASPYTSFLTLDQTYTITNHGHRGGYTRDNLANYEWLHRPQFAIQSSRNYLLFEGADTNEGAGGVPVATTFGYWCSYVRRASQDGWKVLGLTTISRTGLDSWKNSINALKRQYWQSCGAVGLADVAADPRAGADGAYTNLTYFQADGTHQTNALATIEGGLVSNAINSADGYSLGVDGASIATTTYSMLAKDVFLKGDTTSASFTATLISAVGLTGQTRWIKNVGTANVLTVAAASGETIDGKAAITLNAGQSTTIRAVLNSPTTGGAHWETVQSTPRSSGVISYSSGGTTVTGNAADQNICSVTIKGGTVPPGGGVRMSVVFQRAGGTGNWTFKWGLGTTTISYTAAAIAGTANSASTVVMNNPGVSNAQRAEVKPLWGAATTPLAGPSYSGSLTNNFTSDVTFNFIGNAAATESLNPQMCLAEIVQP